MSSLLINALAVSKADYDSLISGKIITLQTSSFMAVGQTFALIAKSASPAQSVEYWARCELCKNIKTITELETFDWTHWNLDDLRAELEINGFILIVGLRVYQLDRVTVIDRSQSSRFTVLNPAISTHNSSPVLAEEIFARRKQELLNLQRPPHLTLIQLEHLLLNAPNPETLMSPLISDIAQILGWKSSTATCPMPEISWVQDIANIGNASDGQSFEKIVRKSLILLGFGNSLNNPKASLEPDATGGPGGLDFFCDRPYLVVGECKASKTENVPDSTPAQLVKLGLKILDKHQYDNCIKILMIAGKLNRQANQTAVGNEMNAITPETLQRLAQLKIDHPGSIDLLKLKPCLESPPFGEEADRKINLYIDKIINELQLRSTIINLVRESSEESKSVEALSAIYNHNYTKSGEKISEEKFRDLLIELSSPVAGYLGRNEQDKFYFLRSLSIL
jgi:hypothetical protein